MNREALLKWTTLPMLFACISTAVLSQDSVWRIPEDQLVSINAEAAWEDSEPGIVHFSGDFRLDAGSWSLRADQATVYGKLDRPDSVVLKGAPAKIELRAQSDNRTQTIVGEAPQIEYLRAQRSVRMSGGALLSRSGNLMKSGEIAYDIETDRFSASGVEGVQISVEPED